MPSARDPESAQEVSRDDNQSLEMQLINDEIARSRQMLQWPSDWDGEGSPAFSEETWMRARDFLWNQAKWFWQQHHRAIGCPRIAPGPNGSIDIHWKSAAAELLINIPVNQAEPLSFYGDTKSGSHIKGSLKDSDYKQAMWHWLQEEPSNFGK